VNKNKVIEFCGQINNIVCANNNCESRRPICKWKDTVFCNQLRKELKSAIENGNLKAPIKFFTQHNRSGNIFRADPQFQKKPKNHGMIG
jgi:hypothetical protein